MNAREAMEKVFALTDAEVARAIGSDRLHRGTALFVLKQFALEAEKLVPLAHDVLVATHTEAAVQSNERMQEGARLGYGG